MSVRLYYHFTSISGLHTIQSNGYIPTADPALHHPPRPTDPTCVWLLDTPDPIPHLTAHGPTPRHDAQVRFTVLLPARQAFPWTTWAPTITTDPTTVTEIILNAGQASATHWYCRFAPITTREWHAVHYQPNPGRAPWEHINFAHLPPIPKKHTPTDTYRLREETHR